MFIEPVIMKATKEDQEYGIVEPKIENLKTYVESNNFKTGDGADAWRANTRIAKQELYGAWTQSQNSDKNYVENFNVSDVEQIEAVITASDKPVSITLEEDLTFSKTIEIGEGKSLIVNLNNSKITSNSQTAFTINGGSLTIKNGTITGSQRAVVVTAGGTATIESGDFTTTREGQIACARGEGSKLIVNGGTFKGQETAVMGFEGAEVIINDGDFTTIDNFAIGTNGTPNWGKNKVTINKAKLTCGITSADYEACGIYIANDDEVIVGSEVEINVKNGCGILMRGGNVLVKEGVKINITTDKPEGFGGYVGDKKTKMVQSGIIYHESADYPGKAGMKLTVENGVKIRAIDHSIEVLSNEVTPNVTIGRGDYTPAYPEN